MTLNLSELVILVGVCLELDYFEHEHLWSFPYHNVSVSDFTDQIHSYVCIIY